MHVTFKSPKTIRETRNRYYPSKKKSLKTLIIYFVIHDVVLIKMFMICIRQKRILRQFLQQRLVNTYTKIYCPRKNRQVFY